MKISEIVKARLMLEDELESIEREYKEKVQSLSLRIEKCKEKERLMSTGFDIEKIELGRKLIEITGNPYAYNDDVKHESQTIASLAIEDILNGCKHLKGEYFGNKQYAGFYQRCDCRYHYCPTYGTIVDEIGLNVRDRELTPEEVEAAVYYIKVYPEIKK